MDDFGGKIWWISWKEGGETWEMLDQLETKQIYGSNPTKLRQTNKSQKNLGLFLVGIFEIGEEHNKIRLENNEGRLQNRDQRGSDTKMM